MKSDISVINKNAEYDVIGIGSALLDFTVQVDDSFLSKLGLSKGKMQLIDENRSREILGYLKEYSMETTPGGSAANTLAGVSNFNGKGIFFGKVGDDSHGEIYIKETERSGVKSKVGKHKSMTGHAITFITPDLERTFATHLGAALQFNKEDIHENDIKNSKIIHMEGYLFEPPQLKEACMYAIKIAKENNVLVSVDLSDPALIQRINDTFQDVVKNYADIVFVNEDEAHAFTGKQKEEALNELYNCCSLAVVKLGAEGSLIKANNVTHRIPVYKTKVVNTNGAGDIYAAGVLYGLAKGYTPEKSGKFGSYASSLVVSQVGARYSGKIDPKKIV